MNPNEIIEAKLEAVRILQEKFPGSHIGGSLGLHIHGISLKRSLVTSDIDITVKEKIDPAVLISDANVEEKSDPEDFDYSFKYYHPSALYTNIDMRIDPVSAFDEIIFEGNNYRVSKLEDITAWKKKYAEKGVEKHIDDLIVMSGGERPERKAEETLIDDLPF